MTTDEAASVPTLMDPLGIVTARITDLQTAFDAMRHPLDVTGSERERLVYEALRTTRQQEIAKFTAAKEAFERGGRSVLAAAHNRQVWERWRTFLVDTRNATSARLRPLPQFGRDRAEQELIRQLVLVLDTLDGHVAPPLAYDSSCYVLPADITNAMAANGYPRQDEHGPWHRFRGWPWMGSLRDTKKQLTAAEKQIDKAERELAAARRTLEHLAR